MAIPLFSGSVGSTVAPLTPPVESLEVRGYMQGVETGKEVPSTASSIARGVEGMVETYQRTRANEARIEAAELQLERERALQSDSIATDQAKLQEQRAQIADATRVRQQRDELVAIFEGNDGRAKVEAVTSGRFTQAFAADKDLQEYAIKVAAPYMPPAVSQAFIKQEYDKNYRNMLMRNANTIKSKAENAESELLTNEEFDSLLHHPANKRFGGNPIAMIERAEFVPQGTYERNPDGSVKRHLDGAEKGQPIRKTVAPDNFTGGKVVYQMVDRDTKQVIGDNISGKAVTLVEKYQAAQMQLKKSGLVPPGARELIAEGRRRAGLPEEDRAPTAANAPRPQIGTVPRSTDIARIPFVTSSGKVVAEKNAALPQIFAKSIGLSDSTAQSVSESFSDLPALLQQEINSSVAGGDDREATLTRARRKEEFVRTSLDKAFDDNAESLSTRYNDAAVKEHNDAYDKWLRWRERPGATGYSPSYADLNTIGGVFRRVTSPKDLYVAINFGAANDRFALAWNRSIAASRQQLARSAQKPQARAAIIDTLKRYK